jgi:hypothetical protein
MNSIKPCKCETNAIIFQLDREINTMVCLRCKTPYKIKQTEPFSMQMPIRVQMNFRHEAEIVPKYSVNQLTKEPH